MGKGMPYHLEKGPTLALLEQQLNRPNDPPGYAQRTLLEELRKPTVVNAANPSQATYPWLDGALQPLFQMGTVGTGPNGPITAQDVRDDIVTRWFGTAGSNGQVVTSLPDSTGYWVAYRGDVAEIIRRTACWAVELSLGLAPGAPGPGRRKPRHIELFWKCPTPWFEGWVVVRPKVISIVFMTPSHQGSNVSESPIASSPTTRGAPPHPIPSTEADYEVLGVPGSPLPVPAEKRKFATWVVTHEDHVRSNTVINVTTNTAAATDFAEWGIPQLSVYEGQGGIAVVSPSFPAGGVLHDGSP